MGDTSIQGIGRCDSSLRTVGVWAKPYDRNIPEEQYNNKYKKGIVYYLSPEDRIVGVVLVGLSRMKQNIDSARRVLRRQIRHKETKTIQQAMSLEEYPESYGPLGPQ